MDQFEAANPGIKVTLLSGPYADTKTQEVAALPLEPCLCSWSDGAWVSDFVKESAITNLSDIIKQLDMTDSQLAAPD